MNTMKNNPHKEETQSGFTIIELLIATTVFSMVLMVILASFLQIGRMYYKGVSLSGANEATRFLVDSIANDIRFAQYADTTKPPQSGKHYFCIGSNRYTYILAEKMATGDTTNPNTSTMTAGIVQDKVNGCAAPSSNGSNARQLLGPNMQLNSLEVRPSETGIYIHAHVLLYGVDNTVFESESNPSFTPAQALRAPDAKCSGNLLSTQLCAVADFKTNVTLRE